MDDCIRSVEDAQRLPGQYPLSDPEGPGADVQGYKQGYIKEERSSD
jgi:hypothetical protein